jgi:hypothetical protein
MMSQRLNLRKRDKVRMMLTMFKRKLRKIRIGVLNNLLL